MMVIFYMLGVPNLLIISRRMLDLYVLFANFLDI